MENSQLDTGTSQMGRSKWPKAELQGLFLSQDKHSSYIVINVITDYIVTFLHYFHVLHTRME
jgi:hypothetical protein